MGSANSDKLNTIKMNRKTWASRWKDYDSEKTRFNNRNTPHSPLNSVNYLLDFFINTFNTTLDTFDFKKEMTQTHGKDKYFIMKYQLLDVQQNNKFNAFIYDFLIVISENVSNPISYTIFAQILKELPQQPQQQPRPYIISAESISNRTTDTLLLPTSIPTTEKHSYYSLHSTFNDSANKDITTPKEIHNVLQKRLKEIKTRALRDQYVCFNTNLTDDNIKDNMILYSSNKKDCASKYDLFGRPKDVGVWDSPCKTDEECPYYGANQNYTIKNNFGKCMSNGYCQLPTNMQQLGYHYYTKNKKTKPLCYNCDTNQWKAVTTLGDCCDKQTDKTQYPFLKTPDYAFKNDLTARVNEDRKRNCYNKHNANTGVTELICKNT